MRIEVFDSPMTFSQGLVKIFQQGGSVPIIYQFDLLLFEEVSFKIVIFDNQNEGVQVEGGVDVFTLSSSQPR